MRKAAVLLIACSAASLCAEVPDKWVWALAQVEAGGVCRPGDGGRARGIYQFHKSAWSDVSKIRAKLKLPVYPYTKATDQKLASEYAKTWLSYISERLRQATGRDPRAAEVFLAHNMGFDGFERIGFQVCRATARRYDTALRFEQLTLSK